MSFRGLKIESNGPTDEKRFFQKLPFIRSDYLINNLSNSLGNNGNNEGNVAYDVITQEIYYNDGSSWKPLTGGNSSLQCFGFIKNTAQTVVPNTKTVLNNFSSSASNAYSSLAQWNLSTGIYTATANENLNIEIGVSWATNFSNVGSRHVCLEYAENGSPFDIIAEDITQAESSILIETTQYLQFTACLKAGDRLRIIVMQTSPINIDVASGNHTRISGFRSVK